jgi:hypothetical protein
MKDLKKLVINILILSFIALIGYLVYLFFIKDNESDSLIIDETPMHIESIRTIAEISTVSFKDEVVMDSIEFFDSSINLSNPLDWFEASERVYNRNVKRRLTIIVKGEIKYGIDLTSNNFKISQNIDTLWLNIPKPKILDILVSPSETEIFQEQGHWSDGARRQLENLAKRRIQFSAENLNLDKKATENAERLFRKLINTQKELIIYFE